LSFWTLDLFRISDFGFRIFHPPCFLGLAVITLATATSRGDDWTQWLGPQRDSVWRETGIVDKFPDGGPKIRWRTPIGGGYAGPAVAGGRVYVTDRILKPRGEDPADQFTRGQTPATERVLCLNEADGKVLWTHQYDCPYTISYPAGPRTTPVIADGTVFTLGAEGHLFCLDAGTGRVLWSHDLKKVCGIASAFWGFASNPLLDGQRLICMAGGEGTAVLAFNKDSGKEIWRALSSTGGHGPGYGSPIIVEAGGRRQLIVWHITAVSSLDPETGKVFWEQPFRINQGQNVPTPRQHSDLLFVTGFYDGSMMLRLDRDRPAASVVWQRKGRSERNTDALHSIICTPFLEEGFIYGVCSYGQLRGLKVDTGERLWETLAATTGKLDRWATAFIVKNGSRFFLFNERGDLIIARLTPTGYEEISRAHLVEPTNKAQGRDVVWSHPAFANRSVYARNDKEIVCASLAAPLTTTK
jgi:outer membrane protein assembly factor BamB